MNASAQTLILVDGSSYLYRAYHALPPLTNSRGEATGAVYGVANMLRTLLREYDPLYIAVVFDAKGKTFREEIYEHYKSNRPPMPDDLRAQIEPLHAIVEAMGLPVLVVEGVEADDVIGTLALQAADGDMDVVISTGDKDMAQLVNGRVTLINTMTGVRMDTAGVREKFGVPPECIIDYLALVGDTSDNIPGIPGVGPKTAASLLNAHGSIDGLLAAADGLKGRVGERVRAHAEQLPLGRQLATIRCDVPLDAGLQDLRRAPPDNERLKALYQRMEFRRLLNELLDEEARGEHGAVTAAGPDEDACYETVLTEEALDEWIARLVAAGGFTFDTETTSIDAQCAELVGISFATEPGHAAYVPVGHDGLGVPPQLDRETVLARIAPLLGDESLLKVGQNLKYDISVLARCGVECRGPLRDTMLESYVVNSTATRHDMDSLALKYLGYRTMSYEDVAGKGAKQLTFNAVGIEEATRYAGEDADITLRLDRALWPRLEGEPTLRRVFDEIEMPLVPVLARMERHGVLIDTDMLARQGEEMRARLDVIEREVHELAGEPFNLGSPKQLQEILFEKLRLPCSQRTPKGQPSTAESVLQELALDYPLPRLILEHRALSKLKSTYTDRLPQQVNARTGRVHTSYHQAVAATGRLSSSDPNLQNIPVRSEYGRRIRRAFVAPPGFRLLAADYSQIELRILAHFSGDERLIAAFREGADIHTATAAEIFGLDPAAVGPEQRRSAKAINFGLIYGMSAFGLARQLGIDRNSAQAYMDRYFARYPAVQGFMDRTRAEAAERGYVETLFGRRLYLPEITARNRQRREYAERAAINAPMQGTAADIIKRAMIGLDAWIGERDDIVMIMQVHDELVFEVREPVLDESADRIRVAMSAAAELAVPLEVDIGAGANWDEAH